MSGMPAVGFDGGEKTLDKCRPLDRTGRSPIARLCETDTWSRAHLDAALRFVDADPMFRLEFGDDVVGRDLAAVLHPGFAGSLRSRLADLVAGRVSRVALHSVVRGRGRGPVVVEVTAVAGGGGPARVVLAVRPEQGEWSFEPRLEPLVLTELRARILEHVAAGMSSAQSARMLYLSKPGVEYHVASLVRKLGAANRTAMVAMAYAAGVLMPDQWPPKVDPVLVL